ncbi:MAG: electron transfer flavoprotein subunit beta/FixA family protein [Verrucomicrobia bacterium]|nr:electron transfer flavoprotein subunit beta/FixA family protein [Verrucomicrobiota bacterium]
MDILVLMKVVPDVVEELEVGPDGKSLDTSFLRTIINERDDHALEQALLLKDKHGGKVTLLTLDAPDIDDVLFTALAKGADRAVKICGVESVQSTQTAVKLFGETIAKTPGLLPVDLILTGVSAIDDLDGLMAAPIAQQLGWAYTGVVTQVALADKTATVIKEFAGGVRGEYEVPTPAVLGIQAAEKPPRYVPVAKVRAAMKSMTIETVDAPAVEAATTVEVQQMAKPQVTGHAEMIEGSPEEVADKICELLAKRGLI